MNDHFDAVAKEQDDDLQKVARSIRPQPKLPLRVLVVERIGDQVPHSGVEEVGVGHSCLRADRWTSTSTIVIRNLGLRSDRYRALRNRTSLPRRDQPARIGERVASSTRQNAPTTPVRRAMSKRRTACTPCRVEHAQQDERLTRKGLAASRRAGTGQATALRLTRDTDDMRARSEHRRLGFGQADRPEQIGGVDHPLFQVPQQPGETLDRDKANVPETGEVELRAQLLGMAKIGPEAAFGWLGRVLTQTETQIAVKVVPDLAASQQTLLRCVENPGVPGDDLDQNITPRPKDPGRLT